MSNNTPLSLLNNEAMDWPTLDKRPSLNSMGSQSSLYKGLLSLGNSQSDLNRGLLTHTDSSNDLNRGLSLSHGNSLSDLNRGLLSHGNSASDLFADPFPSSTQQSISHQQQQPQQPTNVPSSTYQANFTSSYQQLQQLQHPTQDNFVSVQQSSTTPLQQLQPVQQHQFNQFQQQQPIHQQQQFHQQQQLLQQQAYSLQPAQQAHWQSQPQAQIQNNVQFASTQLAPTMYSNPIPGVSTAFPISSSPPLILGQPVASVLTSPPPISTTPTNLSSSVPSYHRVTSSASQPSPTTPVDTLPPSRPEIGRAVSIGSSRSTNSRRGRNVSISPRGQLDRQLSSSSLQKKQSPPPLIVEDLNSSRRRKGPQIEITIETQEAYEAELARQQRALTQLLQWVKSSTPNDATDSMVSAYQQHYLSFTARAQRTPHSRRLISALCAFFLTYYYAAPTAWSSNAQNPLPSASSNKARSPRDRSPNTSVSSNHRRLSPQMSPRSFRQIPANCETLDLIDSPLLEPLAICVQSVADVLLLNDLEIIVMSLYLEKLEPHWLHMETPLVQLRVLFFAAYSVKMVFTASPLTFLPFLTTLYPNFSEAYNQYLHSKPGISLAIPPVALNERWKMFTEYSSSKLEDEQEKLQMQQEEKQPSV